MLLPPCYYLNSLNGPVATSRPAAYSSTAVVCRGGRRRADSATVATSGQVRPFVHSSVSCISTARQIRQTRVSISFANTTRGLAGLLLNWPSSVRNSLPDAVVSRRPTVFCYSSCCCVLLRLRSSLWLPGTVDVSGAVDKTSQNFAEFVRSRRDWFVVAAAAVNKLISPSGKFASLTSNCVTSA